MPAIQEHTNRPTDHVLNNVVFFSPSTPEQREVLPQGTPKSLALMVQFSSDTGNAALMLWPREAQAEELYSPEKITALRTYIVRGVLWRGRHLALREEIECSIVRDGDLYVIEYEPLGIRAYADSLPAAKDAFHEEFVVIWEDFGLAADEVLAPGGIRLRQRLQKLVREETSSDEA